MPHFPTNSSKETRSGMTATRSNKTSAEGGGIGGRGVRGLRGEGEASTISATAGALVSP